MRVAIKAKLYRIYLLCLCDYWKSSIRNRTKERKEEKKIKSETKNREIYALITRYTRLLARPLCSRYPLIFTRLNIDTSAYNQQPSISINSACQATSSWKIHDLTFDMRLICVCRCVYFELCCNAFNPQNLFCQFLSPVKTSKHTNSECLHSVSPQQANSIRIQWRWCRRRQQHTQKKIVKYLHDFSHTNQHQQLGFPCFHSQTYTSSASSQKAIKIQKSSKHTDTSSTETKEWRANTRTTSRKDEKDEEKNLAITCDSIPTERQILNYSS